jgi:hypothetical protein
LLANRDDYSNQKINDDFVPVFTDSFNRYETLSGTPDFVNYSKIKEGPKSFNTFNGKKVLIRRIVNRQLRIMATISDSSMAFKKDVYLFFPYEPGLTEFLVGILNSKLISFILTFGSASARKDDFTQITLNDIRKIGIPPYTEKDVRLLTEKVTSILAIKKADIDADRLEIEAEIDQLVYQLYNLTPEEVELIEKSVR